MNDDEVLLVLLLFGVALLLAHKPAPMVTTSTSIDLPDGSTVLLSTDQAATWRDLANQIVWR